VQQAAAANAEANTHGTGQQPCAARQSEAKPYQYPTLKVWGADKPSVPVEPMLWKLGE